MSIQITITINDTDEKILKNDLLNIQEWIEGAVQGKIENCFGRMRSEWVSTLMNDPSFVDPIPSVKEDFVNFVTTLPSYKDREQREAASRTAQQGA
jgi:hypothetical protein